MNENIHDILHYDNRHLERLSVLLGVIELLKITECPDLETMVNRYNIKIQKFANIIDYLSEDGTFADYVEGDLYQHLINIQLCAELLKEGPTPGSMEYYLSITPNPPDLPDLPDLDQD